MHEFIHPSQVKIGNTMCGLLMHSTSSWSHTPLITLVIKNGNQQMMKIPITVPKVLAAFFSFANLVIFRDIPTFGGKSPSCRNPTATFGWQLYCFGNLLFCWFRFVLDDLVGFDLSVCNELKEHFPFWYAADVVDAFSIPTKLLKYIQYCNIQPTIMLRISIAHIYQFCQIQELPRFCWLFHTTSMHSQHNPIRATHRWPQCFRTLFQRFGMLCSCFVYLDVSKPHNH